VLATDNAMSSDTANNAANCFLTVVEVADRLGVSPKHVRRAIDRGELPVHRFGRAVRIAPEDLERFISRHRA
jgi:excisionase family DNA binding protein